MILHIQSIACVRACVRTGGHRLLNNRTVPSRSARLVSPGCGKRLFLRNLYWKSSFYQDRLGTDIGKTQKRDAFCAEQSYYSAGLSGVNSATTAFIAKPLLKRWGNRRVFELGSLASAISYIGLSQSCRPVSMPIVGKAAQRPRD